MKKMRRNLGDSAIQPSLRDSCPSYLGSPTLKRGAVVKNPSGMNHIRPISLKALPTVNWLWLGLLSLSLSSALASRLEFEAPPNLPFVKGELILHGADARRQILVKEVAGGSEGRDV